VTDDTVSRVTHFNAEKIGIFSKTFKADRECVVFEKHKKFNDRVDESIQVSQETLILPFIRVIICNVEISNQTRDFTCYWIKLYDEG